METNYKNHGFIPLSKPSDWRTGSSAISASVRVPDGNWDRYRTSNDPQYDTSMDTMACTSFSATHQVEMQVNWILANGGFNATQVAWLKGNGYLNAQGKVELSERFTAKVSGTTKQGNSFQEVWDSIRSFGCVPSTDWEFDQSMTWNGFYSEVPAAVLAKGRRFRDTIMDASYEFVFADIFGPSDPDLILERLKESPLQVAIPIPAYHAVSLYNENTLGFMIYDHYPPYEYQVGFNYAISYCLRAWIAPKPFTIMFNTVLKLYTGSPADIRKLQNALGINADGSFGPMTQRAVTAFQKAHNLTPDGIVGSATEKELSKVAVPTVTAHPKLDAWCRATQEREGWSATPPSVSYLNNNPGNLEFNYQPGAVQHGRWAKFDTYQHGYDALYSLLLHACSGASKTYLPTFTLVDFYRKYAPEGDGNDPLDYAGFVSGRTGIPLGAPIRDFIKN